MQKIKKMNGIAITLLIFCMTRSAITSELYPNVSESSSSVDKTYTAEDFMKQSSQALVDLEREIYTLQNKIFWMRFWCKAKWIFLPIPYIHGYYYKNCVSCKSDKSIPQELERLERIVVDMVPATIPNSYESNPIRKHLQQTLNDMRLDYRRAQAESDNTRYQKVYLTPDQKRFYEQYRSVLEQVMQRIVDINYKLDSTRWWCSLWLYPGMVKWCTKKYTSQKTILEYRKLRADVESLPNVPGIHDNALKSFLLEMLEREEREFLDQQLGK